MKALIFNSGTGHRMGDATQTRPKAMAQLRNGETIFHRQLRLLAAHGVEEIVVTTGPFAEQLMAEAGRPEFSGLRFTFVNNEAYARTNYLYSMHLAAEHLRGEHLVLHGDLVFDAALIGDLLADPRADLATYNEQLPQPEKDFKVRVKDGRLAEVSVELDGAHCYAFQPLYRLSDRALQLWLERVARFVAAGKVGRYAEDALNEVAEEAGIELWSYADHFLREVDTLEDLTEVAAEVRLYDFRQQPIVAETRGYVKLGPVLQRLGVRRPLLICGSSFDALELSEHVKALGLAAVRFSDFSANPTYAQVVEAVREYREGQCDGVLSVGGGSAMDVGKCVKLFAGLPPGEDYLAVTPRYSAVPHVVLPTTAGSGSESTHFSVVYVDGVKRSVAHDAMLPDYVFLEPTALATLPPYQKRATALDALCQCIESVWSAQADAESRELALSGLDLFSSALFGYLRGGDEADQLTMARAANLSGRAINLTQTTAPHAMSYGLTTKFGLAHGHAVALCLPQVWREWNRVARAAGDPEQLASFRFAEQAICERLGAADATDAIRRLEQLLELLELERPVSTDPEDLDELVVGVDPQRLTNSPLPLQAEQLRSIYERVLAPADQQANLARQQEFETLVMFDDFCERYQLKYYLAGRTLADAMTHARRSPWSGPLSVAMPRYFAEKLARWRDQLPAGYVLDYFETNPGRTVLPWRIVFVGKSGTNDAETGRLPGLEIRILDNLSRADSTVQNARWAALEVIHRQVVRSGRRTLSAANLARSRSLAVHGGGRAEGESNYLDLGGHRELAHSRFPKEWFSSGRTAPLGDREFSVPLKAEHVLVQLLGREYHHLREIPKARKAGTPAPVSPAAVSTAPVCAGEDGAAPFLSVILPVYNVEKYLPECLDSLFAQDCTDFEIVAVNDGSPDSSAAILDDYAARHPEQMTVITKENGGLSDARNHGLRFARGRYVAFVDSDDVVAPQFVRLMSEQARNTEADIVVCRHSEYWAAEGRLEPRWMSFINSFGHSVRERPELLIAAHPYAWNKVYRRSLFEATGIRYPKGQAFEDSATTFNLMLEANRIELVDAALYFYRMDRPDSITRTFDGKFYDIFKSFDSLRSYYQDRGCADDFREELHELMRRTAFARVNMLESCRDQNGVMAFLDAVYDYLDENAPGWARNKYFRRQMRNPKYGNSVKYRATRHRRAMKRYFTRLWSNRGDDLSAAGAHTTSQLVRMLQLEELQTLVELDELCRERGLTYYLAEGTLLGAIRHQGFIPWDDDVDIAMPRADYEKLIDILARGEAPGLTLFNEGTYSRYHLTFAKVLSARLTGFTNTSTTVPPQFQGPSIDVFPLDAGVAAREPELERKIRRLRDMLLFKVGYMSRRTKRKKYKTYLMSALYPFGYLQRRIQQLYRIHENNPEATYLVNYASSYPPSREKVPASCYGEPRRVTFENVDLPVPADWDMVLRTTYGDYLQLPPPSEQVPSHRPRWRDPAELARGEDG